MNRLLLYLCVLMLPAGPALSQCTETDETRVLLIGDSWANFMGIDQTINIQLEKWGHSNYKFFTNGTIAVNGSQTGDFLQPAKLNEIQNQLNANPAIEVVHLSLGGNDVLNTWNVNFTPSQTDSLLDSVYFRLTQLVDFIKSAKPGIRILWSGYAYPNFEEIINDMAPFQSTHPFYGLWQDMGFPSFLELNTILNNYSSTMDSLAANDPQVDFVRGTGILQYTFGQNTPLGVPPGGSYPPFTAPLPDGYPDYPSPRNSMRNYIITKDCFHLSPDGYNDFIDYQVRKYYHKTLMDDQYFLSEGGTKDGSVSSLGNVSTSLQLGISGQEEFSTHLTFNTTAMPDTGVSEASLFLRRESLTGTNPITGNLQIKVVSGNFGATVDVEAADFSAAGDAAGVPCPFGSNTDNGHWVRLELPAALHPYINSDNPTQFMISSTSGAPGLITFTDATDPELAPVLNITYGPSTVSLPADLTAQPSVRLYPNPTSGLLILESETAFDRAEVINTLGETVMQTVVSGKTLTLSALPQGMYFIRLTAADKIFTQRIVKK